ncbi:aldehyde dehydrogenase (NADP(+)) [Mycolicibacterium agri]|uniref:2,5-dioxovalerate dehydrogenase n=1 Tax=Mycolicibacterium agri TaxID=36811 RepID=A0A2A7N092_MYCAG|nr:aldehyde dehydrogenase (NADP(+)) [Mycolicibacterium agri]PEG37334.1 aldehyde dehydrogenase (NADP(+)) [Mycolicibacterium agri]GFG52411.1 2,5-dioxovalerate dehydrogenase [Mycolicibacterium agri]
MTATMRDAQLTGQMLIAGELVRGSGKEIRAFDPTAGHELEPAYPYGDASHVDAACAAAAAAFADYRATTSEQRARFLEAIADNIDAATDAIAARAVAESGLPQARLTGEVARTTGQLRLFADVLREGSWNGARIDPALPDRKPLPRPDIRQRSIPVGPVAVFGASNFPLAFSVAGGDTASALAAGCPVVVKAHDAHPGTSELVGRAIADAVAAADLPAGTFSLLYGYGPDLGVTLVTDPRIKAVGFTGSRSGGRALVAAAASRPEPIPVYAEMSSINPVFLLDGALESRGADLGRAFVNSLTLGSGQFCTNPGLVIAVDGPGLESFIAAARDAIAQTDATPMLTPAIAHAYAEGVKKFEADAELIVRGKESDSETTCRAALFATDVDHFLKSEALQSEVFGSSSLVVRCTNTAEMRAVADNIEGQLTASIHADESDYDEARQLLPLLELKAGRIIFDGWPTGVEVCHAMVHGGPSPATSDSRTTSVGARAIERFLRPVCYQNAPKSLLPSAIADGNPEHLWRRIDGRLQQD